MKAILGIIVGFVLLCLLTGCSVSPTGNVVGGGKKEVKIICEVGVEVRMSDFGDGTCYDKSTDTLQMEIDAIARSIVGVQIVLHGDREFSEKFINERYKAFMQYDITKVSEKAGNLQEVIVYPISLMDGENIVCDTHPLKLLWEYC